MLPSLPLSSSLCLADTCHGPDSESPLKHAGLLCHGIIQQASEREAREIAPLFPYSLYLTSLWCETAQYSGFGAAAFPDQWRLNTLSGGPCSGMAEMQIFHTPEIKSFQYLLNPKENIFFPFFPTSTQHLPGAMRGSSVQFHNARSTCTCRVTQVDLQTFKALSIFY